MVKARNITVLITLSISHIWNNGVVGQYDEVSSDNPSEMYLKACMGPRGEDDVETVKKALKMGAFIDAQHEQSGQSCLMAATLRGKLGIVEYLLDAGADPNLPEKNGYTPPHGAAFQGRPDVMELLIKKGLDVNQYHEDGFTPLHRACWGPELRHTDTVLTLLENGIYHGVLSQSHSKQPSATCLQMTQNEGTKKVIARFMRPEL